MNRHEMLRPDKLFVMVSSELAREVGFREAGVLQRVAYHTDPRFREAYERDGALWWRGSVETITHETGMSKGTIGRCIERLVSLGWLRREQHRLEGSRDQTYSYSVVYDEPADDEPADVDEHDSHFPEPGNGHFPESRNVHFPEPGNVPYTDRTDSRADELLLRAGAEDREPLSSRAGGASALQLRWLRDLHIHGGAVVPLDLPSDLSNADADEMIRDANAALPRGTEYLGPTGPDQLGWDLLSPEGQAAARRRMLPPRRRSA